MKRSLAAIFRAIDHSSLPAPWTRIGARNGQPRRITMENAETAIAEYKPSASELVTKAKAVKVKTFEQAMDAADFLLDVKTLGEQITTRRKTSPSRSTLTEICSHTLQAA
jgi:hypothetical protein